MIIHIKKENTPKLKFNKQKIIDKKIIFLYSAKKIKANPLLIYSILYPEINSDSPSEKSKGVRFSSAKILTYKINLKGNKITIK